MIDCPVRCAFGSCKCFALNFPSILALFSGCVNLCVVPRALVLQETSCRYLRHLPGILKTICLCFGWTSVQKTCDMPTPVAHNLKEQSKALEKVLEYLDVDKTPQIGGSHNLHTTPVQSIHQSIQRVPNTQAFGSPLMAQAGVSLTRTCEAGTQASTSRSVSTQHQDNRPSGTYTGGYAHRGLGESRSSSSSAATAVAAAAAAALATAATMSRSTPNVKMNASQDSPHTVCRECWLRYLANDPMTCGLPDMVIAR